VKGCEKEDGKNGEDTPSKPICCKAETAQCVACEAGLTVELFCKMKENTNFVGCPTPSPSIPIETPKPQKLCCKANTAMCKACSAGTTVETFCSDSKNQHVKGCEKEDASPEKLQEEVWNKVNKMESTIQNVHSHMKRIESSKRQRQNIQELAKNFLGRIDKLGDKLDDVHAEAQKMYDPVIDRS
jgi:hypothetical protein